METITIELTKEGVSKIDDSTLIKLAFLVNVVLGERGFRISEEYDEPTEL